MLESPLYILPNIVLNLGFLLVVLAHFEEALIHFVIAEMRVVVALICDIQPFERIHASLLLFEGISVAIAAVVGQVLENQHLLLIVFQHMVFRAVVDFSRLERGVHGQSPMIAY